MQKTPRTSLIKVPNWGKTFQFLRVVDHNNLKIIPSENVTGGCCCWWAALSRMFLINHSLVCHQFRLSSFGLCNFNQFVFMSTSNFPLIRFTKNFESTGWSRKFGIGISRTNHCNIFSKTKLYCSPCTVHKRTM